MAFIDSTSDQRVELLRQAEKTANLTRRVTVGSGTLGAPEGADGGELCTALSDALSAIGYGGLPPGGAMVNGGDPAPVLKLGGVTLVTGSTLVEDNVFEGIELAETDTTVSNGVNYKVLESDGTTLVSAVCPAEVVANDLKGLKLPAGIGVMSSASTPTIQNVAGANGVVGTAVVANGKVSSVRLPATHAAVSASTTGVALQNSAGTAVGSAGSLVVTMGVLNAYKLPATTAPTTSATTPAIQNSTGAVSGGNGTVTVTNGAIANVKLPATHAIVTTSPSPEVMTVTGTYTTSVSFTVAGGLITGIVLS